MLYCKITKKYSHCQCYCQGLAYNSYGFFTIEFVYTLFIVTCLIWIMSMYLTLSVHWQRQTSNQLIALGLARDYIERALIEKSTFPKDIKVKEGIFTIEAIFKKYPIPHQVPRFGKKELPLQSLEVIVSWPDERGDNHKVYMQSYR